VRLAPPIAAVCGAISPEPLLVGTFCVLWSLAFPISKVALSYCPTLLLLMIRLLVAGGITLAGAGMLGVKWRLSWRDGVILAALGVINCALYLGLSYFGMRLVPAGLMALIVSTNPVLTALLAARFLHEGMSVRKIIGLLLGVAGVAVIVESRLAGGTASALGIALAVAALLALSGGTVLFRKFTLKTDLVIANGVQTLAGGIALVPLAFTFESVGEIVPTWRFVEAMTYVILCGSVAGYLLWFRLVAVYGATSASAWHFTIPPLGMLFGWILLGEQVHAPDLLGIVPVAAGIWLVTRPAKEPGQCKS
jgi:drug/metabolite transporter (DMT)-like permease